MRSKLASVAAGLVLVVLTASTFAAGNDPPASSEVTAAMQPYLDQYKLAGVIGIIADKSGKVHYKNLLGYADVEAKKPISEDNVFWIASMIKDVRRRLHHDAGGRRQGQPGRSRDQVHPAAQ